MSGDSLVAGSLVAADYVVFALMLVVSTAIGVYFAWTNRGQVNSRDFLTGGRRLTAFPVSISLTASFMSSIAVMSSPAEVYRYGAIYILFGLGIMLSTVVVSEVFLPVFYRLAITSTHEYLEMRFNRATRLLGTVIFIFQTVLYIGIVIYGPALAISQIADVNLWGGIITTGIVCTLYCTLGGLKAVVWTDVFQIGIMLSGYLAVIIKSVILQGGLFKVISDSQQGGRLNILDFDTNPLRRHTFWTMVFGATMGWIVLSGTNQSQVQRYVSCKSITHARIALYIYLFGMCTFLVSTMFAGMCLFSVYKNCDPWTAGQVSALDQLMPYLVMDILTDYPGLPGLFFAAVCSGSLSTVSTSINALATVTLEDLIKPYTNMSEKHLFWMSKGLTFFYGILCIGMAGLASAMGAMLQASVVVNGATGGPLLGVFTLGILCPFATSKGALSGLLVGLGASTCLSIGGLIYPPSPEMARPLPLSTDGCEFSSMNSSNWTSTALPTEPISITSLIQNRYGNQMQSDTWQSPSYLYFGPIGTVTAVIVGLMVSMFTGGWRSRAESRLTLMKEDTTFYYIFMFFKDRVMRREGRSKVTESKQKRVGVKKPGLCSTEMDLLNKAP
ncbi:sodium-coupled monocarboxylate transporter 1-like isoform X1 [Antennarius striatus]|uniref:sodium-coupled monocarboxylate transporter 1-like isoform X1 n=1 Tax=Antennarius striatus TaxID=241820 RepID=UPI0035B23A21